MGSTWNPSAFEISVKMSVKTPFSNDSVVHAKRRSRGCRVLTGEQLWLGKKVRSRGSEHRGKPCQVGPAHSLHSRFSTSIGAFNFNKALTLINWITNIECHSFWTDTIRPHDGVLVVVISSSYQTLISSKRMQQWAVERLCPAGTLTLTFSLSPYAKHMYREVVRFPKLE